MKAEYKITADGQDVTQAIASRLVSLTLKDERGRDTDTLDIVLDDRPDLQGNYIEMPRKGVTLDVSLGFDGKLNNMGSFVVDEVRATGTAEKLTISAKAANMKDSLKERRTRGLNNISLGDLAATIAAEHGLKARVSAALADIIIPRVDQLDESEYNLLYRIGKNLGAVIQFSHEYLLIVPRGEAKTVSGLGMPSVTLQKHQLVGWDITFADRDHYQSVTTKYRDIAQAIDVKVTVGSGRPQYVVRIPFADKQTATQEAEAKLKSLNRGLGTASITTQGDARLIAESQVTLEGMRSGLNGVWEVDVATHTLNKNSGWMVTLDLEINPQQ